MRARNDLEIKNALPFFHSENGDGNQLYYEEKGSGEPFIFLHGNGENSSYFRNQIEHYQNKYRVLARVFRRSEHCDDICDEAC